MSMSCLICWQHTITIILKYEHNEEEEQDATLVLVEIHQILALFVVRNLAWLWQIHYLHLHAICEC